MYFIKHDKSIKKTIKKIPAKRNIDESVIHADRCLTFSRLKKFGNFYHLVAIPEKSLSYTTKQNSSYFW